MNRIAVKRDDGKAVAYIENETLYKRVRQNHFLRKPPALAFDRYCIEQAIEAGASKIEIKNTDSGITYRITIRRFLEVCFPVSRGHGEQLAVILSRWDTDFKNADNTKPVIQSPAINKSISEEEDSQPSLFELAGVK